LLRTGLLFRENVHFSSSWAILCPACHLRHESDLELHFKMALPDFIATVAFPAQKAIKSPLGWSATG
jgi:hypothetical protein